MWDNVTLERFARQVLVEEIDFEGTERLWSTEVAVGGDGPGPEWFARYLGGAGARLVRRDEPGIWVDGVPWPADGPVAWPDDAGRALGVAARLATALIRSVAARRSS
ncbi:MAG: hypothetical protein K6V97_01900 [Actinomycetia bacterium]|nr:hypothetical protein [Actinomycetes bacterium]